MTFTRSNRSTGTLGEDIALAHLLETGYFSVAKNVTSRWGEIDLVVEAPIVVGSGSVPRKLVFVEVKTRYGLLKGSPYEAVTYYKLQHMIRAAQFFIVTHPKYTKWSYRIDVISIVLGRGGEVQELKHFENVTS